MFLAHACLYATMFHTHFLLRQNSRPLGQKSFLFVHMSFTAAKDSGMCVMHSYMQPAVEATPPSSDFHPM